MKKWVVSGSAGTRKPFPVSRKAASRKLSLAVGFAIASFSAVHPATCTAEEAGEDGRLNSEGVKILQDSGVKAEQIVLAMRKVDGDGHWYANFGWDSRKTSRKYYHDNSTLSLLDLKTGKLGISLTASSINSFASVALPIRKYVQPRVSLK